MHKELHRGIMGNIFNGFKDVKVDSFWRDASEGCELCVFVCLTVIWKHAGIDVSVCGLWEEKQAAGSTHGFIDWFLDKRTANHVAVCWHNSDSKQRETDKQFIIYLNWIR